MRVFLSSVITGYGEFRDAAAGGAKLLGNDVIRAEGFRASTGTPRSACLAAARSADVVFLILGAKYGEPDPNTGLSPTHEEFREARDHSRVLVFVQTGVSREPMQEKFLAEVRAWATGKYTADFSTPDDLRDAVIAALHELQVNERGADVDAGELIARAKSWAPEDPRRYGSPTLSIVVAGSPKRQIIRPVALESPTFAREITRLALFGDVPVFDPASGSLPRIEGNALFVEQDDASILVNQLGDIRVSQPAMEKEEGDRYYLPVLIEEDVLEKIGRGISFASALLDHVDDVARLSSVAIIASLNGAGHTGWMTRAQRKRQPDSVTMSMTGSEVVVATLSPEVRHRAALKADATQIAEDLMVMLRRRHKG